MIVYGILYVIFCVLKVIFAPISLPDFPPQITQYLYQAIDTISNGLPLLWVFFDKSVVTVCLALVLACMNFERIYYFIMWVLRKFKLG